MHAMAAVTSADCWPARAQAKALFGADGFVLCAATVFATCECLLLLACSVAYACLVWCYLPARVRSVQSPEERIQHRESTWPPARQTPQPTRQSEMGASNRVRERGKAPYTISPSSLIMFSANSAAASDCNATDRTMLAERALVAKHAERHGMAWCCEHSSARRRMRGLR